MLIASALNLVCSSMPPILLASGTLFPTSYRVTSCLISHPPPSFMSPPTTAADPLAPSSKGLPISHVNLTSSLAS
ncbi:uncharacterized protein BO88DRAFT_33114 [Aspergillus vadensis CBS 113365]|uniref:Uncharacterized protein n=1 Tax=Aspergillus vadensis (strain CBS 113365 / IMI 142717 / IBT 24658) TaxID=1448311 RepID=A0A319BUN7_ASPVC|nr:hypothetical protein BO88DRAFT_33114 [Aspergillus vadensis CBS 113365]PYH75239.1 hypothetical protein BO88DRAFT_33114 [Aspergillus vadensis CBS 113365]